MLKKLKKLINEKGLSQVSSELGYRANTTIVRWINADRVPKIAVEKLKMYLKGAK